MQTINHGKIALYLAVVNFLGTPDQVESMVELLYARCMELEYYMYKCIIG